MAWALVLIFREDYRSTVERWLQRAEQALESEHVTQMAKIGPAAEAVNMRDYITGQVAVIRSQNMLAAFQDPVDPHRLIDLSQQALELLPEIARLERSVCAINLALAHLVLSQTEEAEKALARAQQIMLEAGNYFGAVTTFWYQARLAFYQGDHNRADAICREGLERMKSLSDTPDRVPPAIRSIYVAQAIIRFEQSHLDEAEQLLERSLDSTGWASWVELWAFVLLVRLQQNKGNPSAALQTLDRMEKLGPQHAECAAGLRALLKLLASPQDAEAAAQARVWAQAHTPDLKTYGIVTGLGPYNCDALYILNLTWARVQTELGEGQSALEFLEPVLAVARQNKLNYRMVELLLLKAMALDTVHSNAAHAAALDALREALSLSEHAGYLRVFDQGPALDRLLAEIAQEETHAETVQELAKAFGRIFLGSAASSQRQPAANAALKTGGLIEPLSERELEVLHLIAAGFSNADIAARLVIALGTVKRHINNIYGKLGVESRTQAVDKARKIGILS
jgi:LuxR family maltose regulon positive regulatory protein